MTTPVPPEQQQPTTVYDVANQIYSGTMTVDDAEQALQGVQLTTRSRLTPEEQDGGADVDDVGDNDMTHLSSLVTMGKLSYDDQARLAQVMIPPVTDDDGDNDAESPDDDADDVK